MTSLIGASFLTMTVAMHSGVEWIRFTLLKNKMAEVLNFRV